MPPGCQDNDKANSRGGMCYQVKRNMKLCIFQEYADNCPRTCGYCDGQQAVFEKKSGALKNDTKADVELDLFFTP